MRVGGRGCTGKKKDAGEREEGEGGGEEGGAGYEREQDLRELSSGAPEWSYFT